MSRFTRYACALLFLAGCDPQTVADAGADAAVADAPPLPNDVAPDTAVADAPPLDVPELPDAPTGCGCAASETCLRGVCIATCDGLDGFDAALADGVIPVSHSCRAPGAFDVVGTNVYELEAVTEGANTVLRLVRWAATSGPVTPSTIAQRVYVPTEGELVFPGFVAVNPSETHAVFGYTTTLAGVVGGVIDVTTASMTFTEASAPGNFDAGFILGEQYLVNGQGLGTVTGQALYLVDATGENAPRLVVDRMGEYSGSVALWPEQDLVVFGGTNFSGWPDGTTGGLFFVMDLERVLGTPDPIDAFTVGQHFTLPNAFEMLTNGRVAALRYDDAFAIDGVVMHQLTRTGAGPVSAGPEVEIATGTVFSNLSAIEDDVLLVHGSGALRVTLP